MRWALRHKTAIALALGLIVLAVGGIWFWGVLVGYVGPKDAGDRKDIIQTFALITAGLVGAIGGIVGIANLRQQRELAGQRAQEDALQAYFEHMGALLTDHDLINTNREDIKQLAQARTLAVLARLDGGRKGLLVRFLHGAGLIAKDDPIVKLSGADLSGASLSGISLGGADLSGTDLSNADLRRSFLSNVNFDAAKLSGANLQDAKVTEDQLKFCQSLKGATMRNGQKYKYWVKTVEKPFPRSLD